MVVGPRKREQFRQNRNSKQSAQVSCKSDNHHTPDVYVEAARYVLGRIDLDPASCAKANKRIQAARYYTARHRGQSKPWVGYVYCNPPGDKTGGLVKAFWVRACEHVLFSRDNAVLWAGFSLEQLRSLQNAGTLSNGWACPGPAAFPRVVVGPGAPLSSGGRIYWLHGETGDPQTQPTHGNFFALLGGDKAMRARFRERFGHFGEYMPGRRALLTQRDLEAEILAIVTEPMTSQEIASRIKARKSTVITTVAAMEQRKLIVRHVNGRRRVVVRT